MEEIHKTVLQENLSWLKDSFRPFDVLDKLFEKRILTNEEMDRLKKKKTIQTTIEQLVRSILPRKGPDAFSYFVEALNETKNSHVSEFLLNKEKLQREKIISGKVLVSITLVIMPCCHQRTTVHMAYKSGNIRKFQIVCTVLWPSHTCTIT